MQRALAETRDRGRQDHHPVPPEAPLRSRVRLGRVHPPAPRARPLACALPSPLYVILDREARADAPCPTSSTRCSRAAPGWSSSATRPCRWPSSCPLARALRARCRAAGARFIVNDRADLALAVDADGLHVGQDDLPAARPAASCASGMTARRLDPRSRAQARQAVADGADYVAVGQHVPHREQERASSSSAPRCSGRCGPDVPSPLVAIGGITEANVGEVMAGPARTRRPSSRRCARPPIPQAATARFLERDRPPGPRRWARPLTDRQKSL